MEHIAYKITVRGVVQGVFFRASAKNEAEELGLKGYAKNTPEGDVEIVVFGPLDAVETFIRWCYIGPDNSRVDDVEVEEIISDREFKDFTIIY